MWAEPGVEFLSELFYLTLNKNILLPESVCVCVFPQSHHQLLDTPPHLGRSLQKLRPLSTCNRDKTHDFLNYYYYNRL